MGPFDRPRHHTGLDHFSLFEAHTVHQLGDTLRAEQAHQVILERYEEERGARVALTPGTAAQLAVHTARFVALGTDDRQTSGGFHLRRQLDVGTAARHVGGDGHLAGLARLGDDLCLELVLFRVQDVVFDAAQFQHAAQQFRNLDRGGTDQHRTALLDQFIDLFDHRRIFLAFGAVNQVVLVVADDRTVGRDDYDVQFVNVPELTRFGFGRTGHTAELVVHAEVVLQRNGRECLRGSFDFNAFFGFDGLVQAVRIAASF